MTCDTIKMEMSTNPIYVSVVRLTISGIANSIGFSINDIEDIKVSVSEACTNVIKHSNSDILTIKFNILNNGICIEVKDNGRGYCVEEVEKVDLKDLKEGGLGLYIIKTLMDDVEICSKKNNGTTIKMTKYLGVGTQ